MTSIKYALVDCNNFFVSCERTVNAALHNKPVVVVSGVGGCVLARSNEAKALGIAMGVPIFKIKDLLSQHKVEVCNTNFRLYKRISRAVMQIITEFWPEVEIYSVDEAFLEFSKLAPELSPELLAKQLAQRIKEEVGIPVAIGLAPTRTLAKVAADYAKKLQGSQVYSLNTAEQIAEHLYHYPVGDVWGIGRQFTKKLHDYGVTHCGQLLALPAEFIDARPITFRRTVNELRGVSCVQLRDNSLQKKQIMVSRTFEQRLINLVDIETALSGYVARAMESLRAQESVTAAIYVFLHTSFYETKENFYKNGKYLHLATVSSDTRVVLAAAKSALAAIYRPGYRYKKAGVVLCDISPKSQQQLDLFGGDIVKSDKIMQEIDALNSKLGAGTIQLAALLPFSQ